MNGGYGNYGAGMGGAQSMGAADLGSNVVPMSSALGNAGPAAAPGPAMQAAPAAVPVEAATIPVIPVSPSGPRQLLAWIPSFPQVVGKADYLARHLPWYVWAILGGLVVLAWKSEASASGWMTRIKKFIFGKSGGSDR